MNVVTYKGLMQSLLPYKDTGAWIFSVLWSDDLFVDWLKFLKPSMLPAVYIKDKQPDSDAEMNWSCKRTELFFAST